LTDRAGKRIIEDARGKPEYWIESHAQGSTKVGRRSEGSHAVWTGLRKRTE